MVGVKGLKPSTSRSQTGRAINCATPRSVRYLGDYTLSHALFPASTDSFLGSDKLLSIYNDNEKTKLFERF